MSMSFQAAAGEQQIPPVSSTLNSPPPNEEPFRNETSLQPDGNNNNSNSEKPERISRTSLSSLSGGRPIVPRRISSSSRKSLGKSFRDSLLISLQQQRTSPAPSRRVSQTGNVNTNLQNLHISQPAGELGQDSNNGSSKGSENGSDSRRSSTRSSFPMIPSLRNSLRSSIHSNLKSKKNSITKDINSIMEIYDLISVKDFGYPASNSLHYGLSNYELYLNNQSTSQLDGYYSNYSNQNDFSYYNEQDINADSPRDSVQESSDSPMQKAIALFDFEAENDNELELRVGQLINILYRHGQGWLVGEDPETGHTGLIPEEYVELVFEEDGKMYTANQLMEESGLEILDSEFIHNSDVENIADDPGYENDESGIDHESQLVREEEEQENDSEVFYNAKSQPSSPLEPGSEIQNTRIDDKLDSFAQDEDIDSKRIDDTIEARTTQISDSPINYDNTYNKTHINNNGLPLNDNESNYTLHRGSFTFLPGEEFQSHVNSHSDSKNQNTGHDIVSLDGSEHHDQPPSQLTASNYTSFLENSATTPNALIDKTADSSSSDKFSTELESETSDLQIDNAEMKPYLPEIFRVSSVNSNSLSNNVDSSLSLTNSFSFPRFHKHSFSGNNNTYGNNNLFFNNSIRNSSGYSSGSNSLINGKSGLHASSSYNSNLNLNLTFGSGSPTTAVLTGTAVSGPHHAMTNRRGSFLFGSGLIQSKSTNSINLKMTTVSSMMSIPRSTSLTKSFGGSVANDDVEEHTKFKPPNLLSKDNYFMNGAGGSENLSFNTNGNTSVLLNTDHEYDYNMTGSPKSARDSLANDMTTPHIVEDPSKKGYFEPSWKTGEDGENKLGSNNDDDFWVDDEFKEFEKNFQSRNIENGTTDKDGSANGTIPTSPQLFDETGNVPAKRKKGFTRVLSMKFVKNKLK